MPAQLDLPTADLTFERLYVEVQQFYARHMHLLDAGAAHEWAQTFTEDGTFEAPTLDEPTRGRAELIAAMSRTAAELAAAGDVRRHWHGMLDVRPGADGTIAVRCYALVFSTLLGGAPRLYRTCVCEDVLVFEDGQLRVRSRRVTRDDLA
ncbi:SnoaL-like domain-containing protein [Micromonospora matsumotoense]|uniref:SnoaL-like domain-containing protein n=1 Tax=Micromonospora matsumotoense TaxID=121616 RepID=A0A1C5A224_9ACTN|nr:nuclear transport factor 2 family protein [Micromonospora matsumotoense]SCF39277.1 SnoaL-like domain-containing protein [Micromonospora matsumotoense]